MKRDDDMPIDALPDAAWSRIERGVFEQLDAEVARESRSPRAPWPRWVAVALAGVVAVQIGLGLAFLLAHRGDAKPQALSSTRLTTGAEASETLLGDVSIRLEPASALVVVENGARSSLLMLEHGAARFSVPHRGERPAFVVQAGDVRVEVVGTQFRVERSGGSARVDAYEGTVRVTAGGRMQLLTRGQNWPADDAPRAAATPALKPDVDPASTPNEATPGAARKSDDALPARSDRRRFEQAAALEAADPAQALRIYRGLAAGHGAWAENALYAMGRLELDRGDTRAARRLLRRYVDQHPSGANAADARSLLARAMR